MRYDHAVKFRGQYYKAGEEVPVEETADAPSGGVQEEAKKPGRPRKAAGQ